MPADSPATEVAAPGGAASRPADGPFRPAAFLDRAHRVPVASVRYRQPAQVQGRVRSIRVRPWSEVATLEAVVADETAAITVAFLGRRSLGGIQPGAVLAVEGMVGEHGGKLVMLNPTYALVG